MGGDFKLSGFKPKVKPFFYLRQVVTELPKAQKLDEIVAMLPSRKSDRITAQATVAEDAVHEAFTSRSPIFAI